LAPHFFESLNLNSQLNFGWPLLELTMIPIASYLFLSFRGGKDPKVSFKPVLLMLTGILLWWGIAFGSIVLFAKVMLRQIFPIMALCISFPLLYCGDRAMKKELTLFCLLFCIPIIGHVYNTSTYLQEYPNRISPFRCWALQQQSQDMMLETIALSKKIKQNTLFGDIIFVPRQFVVRYSQPFSFCEYFSQRKLEYEGRDPEERMLRRTEISDYVRNVLPKIYGPGIKVAVYALVRIDRRNAKHQELLARTDRVKDLGDHWILYKLEDPKS
jgi:hypothetical protein